MSSRQQNPRPMRDNAPRGLNLQQGLSQPARPLNLNRPLPPPPLSAPLASTGPSSPDGYALPIISRKPLPPPSSSYGSANGHTRSTSQPFPNLSNGGKKQEKTAKQRYEELEDSDSSFNMKEKARTMRKHAGSIGKQNARVLEGKCMTCGASVKWPSEYKTFRCSTCLMINDLEVFDPHTKNVTGQSASVPRKTVAISLERTRHIIDACYDDFYAKILDEIINPAKVQPLPSQPLFSNDGKTDAVHATIGGEIDLSGNMFGPPLTSSLPISIQYSKPLPPARTNTTINDQSRPRTASGSPQKRPPPPIPPLTSPRSKPQQLNDGENLFYNLESYVTSCLVGCAGLNMSFFSARSAPTQPSQKIPTDTHARKQSSDVLMTPASDKDAFLSELDAKTLLLGDVAENGLWWTGNDISKEGMQADGRDMPPEPRRGGVSARSPKVNFSELVEWYRLILHAGNGWHTRWVALRSKLDGQSLEKWDSVPLGRLRRSAMASQVHLQRTFLKAIENLLKRPGRPLKTMEDCRFLLMLMLNPLIFSNPPIDSATDSNNGHTNSVGLGNSPASPHTSQRGNVSRSESVRTRHSGIVKRILGLLANSPNEIHPHLIAWFSRLSEPQFTAVVEMIGTFVSYRLTHQPARPTAAEIDPTEGLIPNFTDVGGHRHISEVHAALEGRTSQSMKRRAQDGKPNIAVYGEDWQIRAASRVMALFFAANSANSGHNIRKRDTSITREQRLSSVGLNAKYRAYSHGQMIPIDIFYNSMLDHADLISDFEAWEHSKIKFSFCQYPFFLSISAKIRILEHDAKRQMDSRAREAFFTGLLNRTSVSQYLVLRVRRDCLVDDSLKTVSETIGRGGHDLKKGLRIDFAGEEGVDAGGLRKEWFLLLIREILDPRYGLFIYDEDSQYCYFNPFCFESSEQFFLVGVLLGLAIYNSTILDVAFPPFLFKKLLASAPTVADTKFTSTPRTPYRYTLEDLAELKPSLARGFRQLLEFDGDVETTFCRDFMVEQERYGNTVQVPLCTNAGARAVTNSNRHEFVDMYIHYLLETSVSRQYEPFKRGFFIVCGGNALSLFKPEEIELLVRGSDEPLDVKSLRTVAEYDGWPRHTSPQEQAVVIWFWEFFERANPADQRKILGFITGSDRIPAMGATSLVIKLQLLIDTATQDKAGEIGRFPIARTCFNLLGLYQYKRRSTLEHKLWTAVVGSEGFGLK